MAGRQSTSRAELSVVRLRIEGGAQADLGRVRLLGDVLAFLENADQVVADHDRRLKVRGGLPARPETSCTEGHGPWRFSGTRW